MYMNRYSSSLSLSPNFPQIILSNSVQWTIIWGILNNKHEIPDIKKDAQTISMISSIDIWYDL